MYVCMHLAEFYLKHIRSFGDKKFLYVYIHTVTKP